MLREALEVGYSMGTIDVTIARIRLCGNRYTVEMTNGLEIKGLKESDLANYDKFVLKAALQGIRVHLRHIACRDKRLQQRHWLATVASARAGR